MAISTSRSSQNLVETPGLNQVVLPSLSLDETIEQIIGGFGWSLFMQAILVSIPSFFDAQQTFISIYADAEPKWHCSTFDTTCNSSSNICQLPKSAWSWDEPSHNTIISEWGLECASSFITGLPASSFFIGSLIGGFTLATLGDFCLGRKNLLYLSCLIMSVTALMTAFSTNIWMYSSLRFVSGLGRASIITCSLILLTERVGKRWRGQLGMTAFFSYSLGLLSLPAIAYLNRGSSWRHLYLCTSIPAISYNIIAYFFVYESPRWLLMQGRNKEAIAILRRIASIEGRSLESYLSSIQPTQEISKVNPYKLMKDLFKRRWALQQLFAAMVVGFGIGVVYFGMLLGVGNLDFSIYLSVIFNASLLIPSNLLALFFIARWKRKVSLFAFCITSGICSIICLVVGSGREGIQIGLELASFFCSSLAYNVLIIFTIELFPTSVRNSATSLARQAVAFGSVFDPILTSAGRRNEFLSFGIFGLTILLCGFFVIILPETRGKTLCNTMDEQERKDSMIV
jgi:MFS family permease|uniref:Major facilitator superfamily (MFS) profile domain-containing protein n=1 Tax=Fagus sylvatica TaxID=28930 RepID=A0A2N9ISL0_FAGSY